MGNNGVRTLLRLSIPSKSLKEEYCERYLDDLVKRVKDGYTKTVNGAPQSYELKPEAKAILLPNWDTETPDTRILKQLLISEPKALKALSDKIMVSFDGLADEDKPSSSLLLSIFGYELIFNSSSKTEAYWLSKKIEANTCVYCNRQYAFTIEVGDGSNKDKRIARPDFDHWFDKKDYPLLSLSLCNLIPSCKTCNSSIKTAKKFDITTHTHPYIHDLGHPEIKFKAALTTDIPSRWSVKIETPTGSKEEKTVQDLKLESLYDMHGELEVKDLMHFKDSYPPGYLKQLFEDVLKDSKRNLTQHDVYRMLFGAELNSSHFLDRPLSKLKHDILVEIGVLNK